MALVIIKTNVLTGWFFIYKILYFTKIYCYPGSSAQKKKKKKKEVDKANSGLLVLFEAERQNCLNVGSKF